MVRFGQHGQLGQFAQTMYAFVFVHAIQSEDFHASEFMECEMDRLHAVRDSEYEAVDPWEDDRREAMKQLFPNNFPHEERKHLFQLRRKFGSTPIRRHPGFIQYYVPG
ncbi:unnamed protein product [Gongylonema pulchrum]|uniref:Uncharacterized protein n=1 Tax=Gongylonema pulchrum TaxID=637853 RepID=A0A183D065_9BILA|nr:unnamed protein product [Gongylonema pulchrum]